MDIITFLAFYIGDERPQKRHGAACSHSQLMQFGHRWFSPLHLCLAVWGLLNLPWHTCALAALVVY